MFAVSCGESAELFEAVEASSIAQFVEGAVMLSLHLAAATGWDHGYRAQAFDFGHDGAES